MMTIFDLKNKITFGKYKGQTLNQVINHDPQYVRWAIHTVPWFGISDKAYEKLADVENNNFDSLGRLGWMDEFDSDFQFMDFFGNY